VAEIVGAIFFVSLRRIFAVSGAFCCGFLLQFPPNVSNFCFESPFSPLFCVVSDFFF
jgi:hypothetical protein